MVPVTTRLVGPRQTPSEPVGEQTHCGASRYAWCALTGYHCMCYNQKLEFRESKNCKYFHFLKKKTHTHTITNSKQFYTGRVSTLLKCQERSSSSKFRLQKVKQQPTIRTCQSVAMTAVYLQLDLQKCKNAQTSNVLKKTSQLVASRDCLCSKSKCLQMSGRVWESKTILPLTVFT